jgi:hypothetical protein
MGYKSEAKLMNVLTLMHIGRERMNVLLVIEFQNELLV